VPTLYIGLGGTGKDILLRFRKRLYDTYQTPRTPFASFLVLDTDESKTAQDEAAAKLYRNVVLDGNQEEFVSCAISAATYENVKGLVQMLHDERFVPWLHENFFNDVNLVTIQQGAGTQRQAGRMAFYLHYPEIREHILHHLARMRKFAQNNPETNLKDERFTLANNNLEVVIVTSLAGGTGSGMFIDVAYLIQDIIEKELKGLGSSHVTLIAILPQVFKENNPTYGPRFMQNGYAALLEMEKYATWREEDDPWKKLPDDEGLRSRNRKEVEFWRNWDDSHGRERPLRKSAWGTCYLIDNVNPRMGGAPQPKEEIFHMVADYLYLDFGAQAFAKRKRSLRSNHVQLRENRITVPVLEHTPRTDSVMANADDDAAYELPVLYGETYGCSFSSFGVTEIYIDKNRIDRAAAYRLAERLIARCWIGAADQSDNVYEDWALADLQGEVSFRAGDLRAELYRDANGQDRQALLGADFKSLAEYDGLRGGTARLREVLDKHARLLAKDGAAGKTLDDRLLTLRGNRANVSGKLRDEITRLAQKQFNQHGARPTLKVLSVYREEFVDAANKARNEDRNVAALNRDHEDIEVLARLLDAEKVRPPCRSIAVRAEYKRACQQARELLQQRYRQAAAPRLADIYTTLRDHVGPPETGGGGPQTGERDLTLHDSYLKKCEFLENIAKVLKSNFEKLLQSPKSERKQALMPDWDADAFDEQIDAVLIHDDLIGPVGNERAVNWDNLEAQVLIALRSQNPQFTGTVGELIDEQIRQSKGRSETYEEFAERVFEACDRVLNGDALNRKGIPLSQFGGGNVVTYLMGLAKDADRKARLTALVNHSAAYFPIIDVVLSKVKPAPLNILGCPSGDGGEAGEANRRTIIETIRGIAQEGKAENAIRIDDTPASQPTSLILVCEMGGLPLHYYLRLTDMQDPYRKPGNDDILKVGRRTCHIRWRETEWELPNIELLDADSQYNISRNYKYFLWMLMLRTVVRSRQDGIFTVQVKGDAGNWIAIDLGTRVNRVLKNACNNPRVRQRMQQVWTDWLNQASAKSLAVLYTAIRLSLMEFSGLQQATSRDRTPPLAICFARLLVDTDTNLCARGDEGTRWLELLREPNTTNRKEMEERNKRFQEKAEEIRTKCLTLIGDDIRIYQIDEGKIDSVADPT
jgi:hypothetical protein